MELKIGDRVRYIHIDDEEKKATGYFPPIGTHGTVMDMDEYGPLVKWDRDTRGNGKWWCALKDVENVYHYRVEVLIGTYRFSRNCNTAEMALDALNGIFNAMPNTKRNDVDFKQILAEIESGERISYNECPISICRIHGTGV
jgi:hypothetical protein